MPSPRRSTRSAVVAKTRATNERASAEKKIKSAKGAAAAAVNSVTRRLSGVGSLGRRINRNNTMGSAARARGRASARRESARNNGPLIKPATFEYPPRPRGFSIRRNEPHSGLSRTISRSLQIRKNERAKRVNNKRRGATRRALSTVREANE